VLPRLVLEPGGDPLAILWLGAHQRHV
jgi:hypothetical protein